jgi:type IX secretion system PorP/SprF family membrane protein
MAVIALGSVPSIGLQVGYAQLIGPITQFYSNELIINPAFAGSHEALSLTATHRSQWSGLEGAPSTQTFSIHSLTGDDHVGLGLAIINDKIGVHQNLTALNTYSYRLKLKNNSFLALGIQAGFNYRRSDYSSLASQVQDPNDPSLTSGLSVFKFEFGAGIYFKSPNLSIGLSAPRMTSGRKIVNNSLSVSLNRPQYFLFIRYRYPISPNLDLLPGVLVTSLPGLPVSMTFNLSTNIKKVLLLGLAYRPAESIGGILQMNITPQLKFGYSYDLVTSPVSVMSSNSHEITINYLFKFTTYKIKNVR